MQNDDTSLLKREGESIFSTAGEHTIDGDNFILMGGYFRACLLNTFDCIADDRFTVKMPMRAIYFSTRRSLWDQYQNNKNGFEEYLQNEVFADYDVDIQIDNDVITIQNK